MRALPKKRCLELSSLNKYWSFERPKVPDTFFWAVVFVLECKGERRDGRLRLFPEAAEQGGCPVTDRGMLVLESRHEEGHGLSGGGL